MWEADSAGLPSYLLTTPASFININTNINHHLPIQVYYLLSTFFYHVDYPKKVFQVDFKV